MAKKVYIGVGHGGSDPGAVKFLVEKDINLKMALACRDYLKAAGVETKISRETDKDSSINEKVAEANAWGADLALDVHNNAGGGDGAEVYHSVCYGTGAELAKNILAELEAIGQNSRGTKIKKNSSGKDYFGFIRSTTMPAVIPECVFVDNADDAAQADTGEECKMFGVAIAKGVLKTLGITADAVPEQAAEQEAEQEEKTQETNDTQEAYLVRVTASALNIRKGPSKDHEVVGVITDNKALLNKDKKYYHPKVTYTIVETQGDWGRLKSGAGWVCLKEGNKPYTEKV